MGTLKKKWFKCLKLYTAKNKLILKSLKFFLIKDKINQQEKKKEGKREREREGAVTFNSGI